MVASRVTHHEDQSKYSDFPSFMSRPGAAAPDFNASDIEDRKMWNDLLASNDVWPFDIGCRLDPRDHKRANNAHIRRHNRPNRNLTDQYLA